MSSSADDTPRVSTTRSSRSAPGPSAPAAAGEHRLSFAASVVLLVPAVATVVAWRVVSPLWVPVPTWDQWTLVELFQAHYEGGDVSTPLLEPYQGHLNVLHKAIVFVLGVATRWDVIWEPRVTLVLLGLQTLLLVALLWRTFRRPTLLMLAAAVLTFSFVHYETILAGYQLGQALSLLCASLAVVCLALGPPTAVRLIIAIMAAAAATFSWAAGVVAWPVGWIVLLARLRSAAFRTVAFWLWGALGAGAVLLGERAGSDYHGSLAWAHLPGFVIRAVGSPLAAGLVAPELAPYLGAGAIAALLLFAAAWLRSPSERVAPWLALGLLALANAVVIGLGRAREGVEFALTSRYAHSTYLLWLSLAVLAYAWLESRARSRRTHRSATTAIAAAELAVLLLVAYSSWLSFRVHGIVDGWRRAEEPVIARLVAGTITDDEIRAYFHPDVALVRTGTQILRRHHLGAWSEAPSDP